MSFKSGMRLLKKGLKGFFIFVPSYVAFTDLFYTVRTVDGLSMQPTLNPDGLNIDFVLLNRWSTVDMKLERGDIVSLISPKDPSQWLIKRVVALEGDEVKADSCFEEVCTVPKGHCWVEGDNRKCSMDSNNFGPVSLGLVTAKATHVIWPPDRWTRLDKKDTTGDRVVLRENRDTGRVFFGWE